MHAVGYSAEEIQEKDQQQEICALLTSASLRKLDIVQQPPSSVLLHRATYSTVNCGLKCN